MFHSLGSVLLRIVFFCILTPLALVMRLFGYDPLKIKANEAHSQWSKQKSVSYDQDFFHKQG